MIKLWKAPYGEVEQRATGESPTHSLKRGKADDLCRKASMRPLEERQDFNKKGACFIVKDDSFVDFNESSFKKWLENEGFETWRYARWFETSWVYINIDTKLYSKGMEGIKLTNYVGCHAITIDEFKTIYYIFKKYEGMPLLQMKAPDDTTAFGEYDGSASNRKDDFTDNTFSDDEWSAPWLDSFDEIRERLLSFRLVGRKIKRLRIIGMAYNLDQDFIEEMQDLQDEWDIDPSTEFERYVEIDEPMLMEFEDGDVFEFAAPRESVFCMSMNKIPWDIHAGTNPNNADAGIVFAPCIGKTVTSVELRTYSTDDIDVMNELIHHDADDDDLVSSVILWFEDGTGLRIYGYIDYTHVVFMNKNKKTDIITFGELKPAILNWEDYDWEGWEE